jgi:5'-3' exonuclease
MDKILFIDAHNQMHRACISFGGSKIHENCLSCINEKHTKEKHCICGAAWNTEETYCYGDKYLYVYNFFRNLRPLIEDFSPDKAYFVLEGRPQFRYDLYSDYKANRIIKQASVDKQASRDKFQAAKEIIVDLMHLLPITLCRAANYEADDLVATLCENMRDEELTILSNDNDYKQLLQKGYNNLRIYNPIKKEFMENVDYPFLPHKCLVGDKSDNIKRLVSDKKALEILNDPKKFSDFLDIEENRANFAINKKLIEFAEVPLDEIIITTGQTNFTKLKEIFVSMKFNSFFESEKTWEKYINTFSCIKY